jgi:nucleoside-diphosphate-sugar epimerase
MKVAVTGATGFIGLAVTRVALARGHDVVALHRSPPTPDAPGARWTPLQEWLDGEDPIDGVIHAAALRHRHGALADEYARVNIDLTRRVLQRAARGSAFFTHVSSISVYGWPPSDRLPIDESFPPMPLGPYGRSKVATEALVTQAGLPFSIVQPSITYGPGDTNGMIDRMMRLIARHAFVVPGLGRTRVQLVFIDDLARIIVDATESRAAAGQCFICTHPHPIRVGDLVRLIARAVGGHIAPVGPPVALLRLAAVGFEALDALGAFRGGEPPLTREKLATLSVDRAYSVERMRRLLGEEARVGYAEGLARTARAMHLEREGS